MTSDKKPVCDNCNDQHLMSSWEDCSEVMCTACPVPCQKCRRGGNGPYCETTPCACACHHGSRHYPLPPEEQAHPSWWRPEYRDDALLTACDHAGLDAATVIQEQAKDRQRLLAAVLEAKKVQTLRIEAPSAPPAEESTCNTCKMPIRWTGRLWEHSTTRPRHPAVPVTLGRGET